MQIEVLPVGPLATNCYLLCDEETKECAVIDPGAKAKKILDAIAEKGMKCTHILLTHGHYDHIMALKEVKEATGAPVYIHENDAYMLTEQYVNGMRALADFIVGGRVGEGREGDGGDARRRRVQ